MRDQGGGIADDILEKLGTPFLQPKITARVSLTVCYSIAVRHGAKINVETGAAGTTFFVRFKQKN